MYIIIIYKNNRYSRYLSNINNIIYLINICIGIYFTTIIYNNCDIYYDYTYTCIIIKLISIKSLLLTCVLLIFILSYIKNKYFNQQYYNNNHYLLHNNNNNLPICIKIYNVSNITCIICLEDQQINDDWIYLKCNHKFHKSCISHWINLKNTCPICRIVI